MENIQHVKYVAVPLLNSGSSNEVQPMDPQKESTSSQQQCNRQTTTTLDYGIDDVPSWYLCLLFGFQHYLTMLGGAIAAPLIVSSVMCIGDDWVATSEIMSTILFVAGIATILQCAIGCRLPIIQGPTFIFLLPAMALFSTDKWKCVEPRQGTMPSNVSELNADYENGSIVNKTAAGESDIVDIGWQARMREIQGAIILASLLEVLIGATGLIGVLLRFIGPLTIAPVITLVALPLFSVAAHHCETNWWIAFLAMILIALFSQYLRNVDLPIFTRKDGKWRRTGFPIFRVFPVILAIAVSWIVCGILTVSDAIPNDPNHWGYKTRTDTKTDVLRKASWFRVPYPFQWGMPTFSVPAVLGMMSAVLAGIIESVGDYYACARLSGAPVPHNNVVNRGIFIEGISCVMIGIFGTGTGLTSYSENIGAISITRVASRRVMFAGASIMILLGVFGKFAALFVSIPEPVVGGLFVMLFGIITSVGISNLQLVDMNSSRNLFVFGVSVMLGMTLPIWLKQHPGAINTGIDSVDQTISVLAMTNMFVGGLVAFVLDNTIPGTKEERGIKTWHPESDSGDDDVKPNTVSITPSTYDLPYLMPAIRRCRWFRFVPICPTFQGFVRPPTGNTNDVTTAKNNENGFSDVTKSQGSIKTVQGDETFVYELQANTDFGNGEEMGVHVVTL
jgi:nucleobase transporter 1/2